MASSEGATEVSVEERFERKRAELIEWIEKLAERLSLDEEPNAATTSIDGRDVGAGSTSRHTALEDELQELIRQYEMLAAQLDSGDGHGAVANTTTGRNLEACSASINHVAQLLQHTNVDAEPDNNNNSTHSNTMLGVYTGVAMSTLIIGHIIGLYFEFGGS